jgi:hypothetical protein
MVRPYYGFKGLRFWRRGWDLNPTPILRPHKLLIFRAAVVATVAAAAVVGYSFGTDPMRLTEAQSRELLAKYGVYVTEVCDKCGKILGHVRFARYGEPGEWCSHLCRDGAAEPCRATRKGGRPPKYRNDRERRMVERRQNAIRQQAFRQRRSVTENPLASC